MATPDQGQAAILWAIIKAIAFMAFYSAFTLCLLFGAASFGFLDLNVIMNTVVMLLAIQSALLIQATYLLHALRPNEGWSLAVLRPLFRMPPGGDAWEGGFWHREADEIDVEKALERKSIEVGEKEVVI